MPSLLSPAETQRMFALMRAEREHGLTVAESEELASLKRWHSYRPTYLGD